MWSRRTGKPLARAIVWADSRTKHTVAHLISALGKDGLELENGRVALPGKDATDQLQALQVSFVEFYQLQRLLIGSCQDRIKALYVLLWGEATLVNRPP